MHASVAHVSDRRRAQQMRFDPGPVQSSLFGRQLHGSVHASRAEGLVVLGRAIPVLRHEEERAGRPGRPAPARAVIREPSMEARG